MPYSPKQSTKKRLTLIGEEKSYDRSSQSIKIQQSVSSSTFKNLEQKSSDDGGRINDSIKFNNFDQFNSSNISKIENNEKLKI